MMNTIEYVIFRFAITGKATRPIIAWNKTPYDSE